MAEANQWEVDAARQSANDAAQNAYNQGMLELGRQDLAFKKAQQAWKETMEKAGLTGTFEGAPTQAALQYGAEAFGVWGAPQQGQTTLSKQQQDWAQAAQNAAMYGSNVGQGGPAAGTLTLGGAEQQFTQGLRTQQEQRAAQQQQQAQAQAYLQLLSSLRGPADWAKYQQVLGSTPGGMRDLVGAAMGQYVPGGGATTGYAPEAVSLQSMMGQVSGQGYNPAAAGQPLNTPNVYGQNSAGMYAQQPYANQIQQMFQPPPGTQAAATQAAPAAQVQYSPTDTGSMVNYSGYGNPAAQTQAMLQGQTNPQAYAQQAMQQPQQQNNQALNAQGGGTNTMGAQPAGQPQANQMNLPAPNQIAAQSWNNLAPSQRDMLMGQYEAQGWHKPDVEALRQQALPKYAANAPTAGTFRLR